MKTLVVDDEAPARRRLIRLLERLDDVEVVGEAGDGVEARERITELDPDLVFLDIQMPALDGLALARELELPALVFVTAYDEHALAAFEVGAVDYLLKPVSRARLRESVERVRARLAGPGGDAGRARHAGELAELRATLARLIERPPAPAPAAPSPRVHSREGGTVRLFGIDTIGRFYAADKYTLFRADGREQVLDESLSELELRLREHGFVRVHRSELVNLAWVTALHSEGAGHELELRDGSRAPVSRRMVAEVKRLLGL